MQISPKNPNKTRETPPQNGILRHRWALLGTLVGAVIFIAIYGVRLLNPAEVDWILNNPSPDPAQHYLGWAFYRASALRLPYLGANYSVIYPFRTSVLFTDSIPLLAVLGKLLGGVLPAKFQYFGLWGLLCFMLQGALGQRVVARVAGARENDTPRQLAALLGAGLLVLFPAVNIRIFAHSALAATWLVLLAFYLYLQADQAMPTARRACLLWGLMGLLCAGVHLYYLPMVGLVLVAWAVRGLLQKRGAVASLLPIACFCGAALAEIVLLGGFAANFAGYSNGYLNGADLLNLFVPGLAATWEQNVYMGLGGVAAVVLAAVCLVVYAVKNGLPALKTALVRRKAWVVSGAVLLVLDAVAAAGNTVTVGGKALFTIPLPGFLFQIWAMFSSCARLLWVAGLVLTVLGCGAVLRFAGGKIGAVLLAVCLALQVAGQWEQLSSRYETYHTPERYADQTLLTDPAWDTLAAQQSIRHLAFASFDFEQPAFWDLAAFAADNHWTTNSFYMAHMDGNLAAVTLPGELNTLEPATLYVFLEEDELARDAYPLHYYRLDGILLGSVEPLELPPTAADARPAALSCATNLENAALVGDAAYTAAGITLGEGGQMRSDEWTIFPGVYDVTLTGTGFDHSYIYARHGLINEEPQQCEIEFTGIAPEKMTFRFTAPQVLHYWSACVHTLDANPITITDITVEKVG